MFSSFKPFQGLGGPTQRIFIFKVPMQKRIKDIGIGIVLIMELYILPVHQKKKGPIIKFYVAAAAVLSNLKRIEDTCRPTTVAGHGNNVVVTYANRLQTCHQSFL